MSSPHPRPRGPQRLRVLIVLLGVLVAACSGSEPGPTLKLPRLPATFEPAVTLDALASEAAEERLQRLLAGDIVVANPSLIDWSDVEQLQLPGLADKDEFCQALDRPYGDDVLTELLALGLNSLSRRFRGGDLSDEIKKVLELAVTFSIETCPTWKPALLPAPTPAQLYAPQRAGFTTLPGNPAIEWRLVPRAETECSGGSPCWQAELAARDGCPTYAGVSIAVTDAFGTPLGLALDSRPGIVGGVVERFSFLAEDIDDVTTGVFSVICV